MVCYCYLRGYAEGELERLEFEGSRVSDLLDLLGSRVVSIYFEVKYCDGVISKIFVNRKGSRKYFRVYHKNYTRSLGWKSKVEKKPLSEWDKEVENIKKYWLQGFFEGAGFYWEVCFSC